MQEQLKILEGSDEAESLKLRGSLAISSGKVREYEKFTNQAVAKTAKEMPDAAADYAAEAATYLAALNKCADAQNWANRALKLDRGQQILTDVTLAFAVCGEQTEPLIAELKQRFPKNTVAVSIWLPIVRAAEMKNAPDRALETLEINRQFEGAAYFWDNYLRGKSYLKLNQTDLAEAEFQKIVQNRGWAVTSPLYVLAHRELAQIYKLRNDAENAKIYTEKFTGFWRNADADLF